MIVDFSIAPFGRGESLSEFVADAFRIIEASGLPYEHHAMGTNIEGEWEEVMTVIKACRDSLRTQATRVSLCVRIDDRAGTQARLRTKVPSARSLM